MKEKNVEGNQQFQLHQFNRYKYVIENIKDVIWEMNMDFVFTFVSPNRKAMSGYEPMITERSLVDRLLLNGCYFRLSIILLNDIQNKRPDWPVKLCIRPFVYNFAGFDVGEAEGCAIMLNTNLFFDIIIS